VGTTLAVLANRAGWTVAGIAGRDEHRAATAAKTIAPATAWGPAEQIARSAQLVLLTVPDDAIEDVCRQLAQAGAFAAGGVVAHCSGALSSEVLAPARELCGAAVGSMHPLQTFPGLARALDSFPGTYCFCEGDAAAVAVLEALAEAIGGKPVRLATEGKLLYHAAAVFACNYVTALLDAALAAAGHAGIKPDLASEALTPIVRATIENALSLGPAAALTGPIARGDCELVRRQLAALAGIDPQLAAIYRVMGRRVIELALRKATISDQAASALREALAAGGGGGPVTSGGAA